MKINKNEDNTHKWLTLMCGQSWICACYLAMTGDVECCHWFSWALPLFDYHSHTNKINNKSEMSIIN